MYLFQDDDEARCRRETVGHHHICRQESHTHSLVEQEYTAKHQTAPLGVRVRPSLGLCPQVEQRVRDQQHGQEHADPRAHHQGELSKRIDQQVKVQHHGGEKTAGTGAGSRTPDSSIRLSMKSLTWLSNWCIRWPHRAQHSAVTWETLQEVLAALWVLRVPQVLKGLDVPSVRVYLEVREAPPWGPYGGRHGNQEYINMYDEGYTLGTNPDSVMGQLSRCCCDLDSAALLLLDLQRQRSSAGWCPERTTETQQTVGTDDSEESRSHLQLKKLLPFLP
ncbi:hypothetical protein EYF80_000536 [Liparis tanakae]|uniref:Uncharacterized protein n=1 Tax=Liparis tanakae TaxID=230148 RepID=A0A4Z2JHZ0_9TELE|nr:hypothetical protein EYF80_000536 [Liparis tanakae]